METHYVAAYGYAKTSISSAVYSWPVINLKIRVGGVQTNTLNFVDHFHFHTIL